MTASPAPFVRFSRDKRGYESVYLVHVSGRPARPRVLYWFRTPPGVKLGRSPFDEDVRRALELQYPDIRFDWKRIVETQPPPVPEVEHWRERRRAERSAKQARQAAMRDRGETTPPDDVDAEADEGAAVPAPATAEFVVSLQPETAAGPDVEAAGDERSSETGEAGDPGEPEGTEPGEQGEPGEIIATDGVGQATPGDGVHPEHHRRRRRRGGRRRNRGTHGRTAGQSVEGGGAPASPDAPGATGDSTEPTPPAGTGDASS